jgi:alpha-glucosidase
MNLKAFAACCFLATVGIAATPVRVASPDGNVTVEFVLQEGGSPAYRIDYLGKPVVLESRLGFPELRGGFTVANSAVTERKSQWTNDFGERRLVPDHYRELNVDLRHTSGALMRISFRAYDEGAALRYSFPRQSTAEFRFSGEATEFRFPPGAYAYEEHSTEGEYARVKVADIQPQCERPLTVEYADGRFASLTEADNERYPRMLLSPLAGVSGALVSALGGATSNGLGGGRDDGRVALAAGESTPWRVFVVGRKPGDLLERNYLLLNLNPPNALKDTSWIKPGKAMRDTTLTTANAKAIVDFGSTAGLQYVGFDTNWYGAQDLATGDATTVRVPTLDMPEVVRYAASKGMGVCLYVDRRQIKKQRDVLFPLYESWGIKAVKIGYVDVGPQEETAWITETIAKAAEHHLALDIHDGYRPTGNNRTYPNLLTVEGIRGNEHMPTPEHNATLPFTRYINGIGDYTVCYYTPRKLTTFAHQLAMAVVSFSPMQWIFWYDKPSDYQNEPEIEFFRHVPTVWDQTKLIQGQIGQYASIARQKGDEWFIGTVNSSQPRTLEIPLAFLTKGRKYTAHIYSDDDRAATRTKVGIETRPVDSGTVLSAPLRAAGGQAIWIELVK